MGVTGGLARGMIKSMTNLKLYTRPECHLCDEARALVDAVMPGIDTRLPFDCRKTRENLHEDLAKAVAGGDVTLIYGDTVFRSLGRMSRLKFQNIGVRKHGRRNIRYAMYTGADVAEALSVAQRARVTTLRLGEASS